jgi:hypothetical protein
MFGDRLSHTSSALECFISARRFSIKRRVRERENFEIIILPNVYLAVSGNGIDAEGDDDSYKNPSTRQCSIYRPERSDSRVEGP